MILRKRDLSIFDYAPIPKGGFGFYLLSHYSYLFSVECHRLHLCYFIFYQASVGFIKSFMLGIKFKDMFFVVIQLAEF